MHESWRTRLAGEVEKPYFQELAASVRKDRQTHIVFPPQDKVFTAFKVTPFEKANVVILGQDPYHDFDQAHGLSFSVLPGQKPPPSLKNIYRELEKDVNFNRPEHGFLMRWAEQGVFLLNSVLTVRAHEPGSHRELGWQNFTDAVIRLLNEREIPVVFVLWGRYARDKSFLIDSGRHTVLESAHPSPMSADRGFFGSRPFSRTNAALRSFGLPEIDWQLPLKV